MAFLSKTYHIYSRILNFIQMSGRNRTFLAYHLSPLLEIDYTHQGAIPFL